MKPNPKLAATLAAAGLLALVSTPSLAGADGSVDDTFRPPKNYLLFDGTAHHNPVGVPVVAAVLSQTDGKMVVVENAGLAYEGQNGTLYSNQIVIRRLLPDGSKDAGFGDDGVARIQSPYQGNEYYEATSAALDPNGRIAIAGLYADLNAPRQNMAVWMVTPQGTRDASFGTAGMQIFVRGGDWSLDRANAIHAFTARDHQAHLRARFAFMVVGEYREDLSPGDSESNPGPPHGVAWMIGADGAWDIGYDLAGDCDNRLNDVAVAPLQDGSGVVAYVAGDWLCGQSQWAFVQRLRTAANGYLYPDASFGDSHGVSRFFYTGDFAASTGSRVAIDTQMRPVVAGASWREGGWNRFGVVRLTTAGQFDTSFGGDGSRDVYFSNVPLAEPSRVNVTGLLLQHDGKIVIGGDVEQRNIPGVFFTMRMNADGSCDNDWSARFTLSYMSGTPPVRTWVDCAGWYYSPAENYVKSDEVNASAMTFTQGERLLLAGSVPQRGFGTQGDWALLQRYDNDRIFTDDFGW